MLETERLLERLDATRCVVFDVDDTLYLERDYACSGFHLVGTFAEASFGIVGLGDVSWRMFRTGVRGHIFDRALAEIGVRPEKALVAALVQAYRHHRPDIAVTADAASCLQALSAQIPLGIITDGPVPSQRAKIEALGLSRWMRWSLVTGEMGDGFGKPDRRSFELVERLSGQRGPACVYIADNPHKDFAAPRALGWSTVRVRRPGSLHVDADSRADVDIEVEDLEPVTTAFLGRTKADTSVGPSVTLS